MEIVVRAAVIWLFLWIVTRAVGRSTLGELSTFQLILYVTRLLPITHGVPIIIVREGEPDLKALTAERMSINDLYAAAREQGIRRLSDIELAVLEADGKISFFSVGSGTNGAPEPTATG